MAFERTPDRRLVAGYRLEERLGEGGGGRVFRAVDDRTGRTVALKLVRDARAVPRLCRAMAVLHPNLVRVTDVGADGSGAYVVMELLRGTSLRAVLARLGRLEVPAAAAVVLPVLDALHAAHVVGVVHGDLKPDNVFLERGADGEARVKVLDLGGVPAAPDPDVVFGSAAYLSPEQANGERLDARSDVFGAAILLFELVTGRPPFDGPGPVAAAFAVAHAPAPRVDHAGVQALLDVALAKPPSKRFPDAAAFARALAAVAPAAALSAAALSVLVRP